MPKATQQVERPEYESRSPQALFSCTSQVSFSYCPGTVHTPSRNGILSVGVEVGVDKFCCYCSQVYDCESPC